METRFVLESAGLSIPCILTEPESGPIRRVVLGVHGLCGSARDQIQEAIAEEMDLFYAATVRFDFPGHGESPTDSFTLKGCTDTLCAVAAHIRSRYPEVEDLCVFATGFGAYITLLCLDELLDMPGRIKLVVQTPSVMMHETLLAMKGINRETLWALDSVTYRINRPLEVSFRFFEDLQRNIVLNAYPIPMLILHGGEDAYISMDHIHQFRRINEKAKLVVIPGIGHRFLEDGAWDMVLDLTRDWFAYEQVLCCDRE